MKQWPISRRHGGRDVRNAQSRLVRAGRGLVASGLPCWDRRLGCEQRHEVGGCRHAAEFRVKKSRNRPVFPRDANGAEKSSLAQRLERTLEQTRAEAAVAVFHQDARSGRKMVIGSGIKGKHGRANNARAVTERQTYALFRSKRVIQP